MSQERMDGTASTPAKGASTGFTSAPRSGTSYDTPDVDATISRASNIMKKVRVVHGANEGYYELEGKSVGSVRKSLREVFNIPGDAEAIIGGKTVSDDFILEGGQQIEFCKESGTKGKFSGRYPISGVE